jgi:tRNA G18 (ribose-2'-O)-methylase SpoU
MYRLAQKEILGLADKREVKIRYVDKTVLDSFSENKHHQVRYYQPITYWHDAITMSSMN